MKEFSWGGPLGEIVFSGTGVVSKFLFSVVRVKVTHGTGQKWD